MVVEDMRNTGVLGKPREYFIPWSPDKGDYGSEDMERVLAQGRTDNRVSAVKVMADQAARIDRCLQGSYSVESDGPLPNFLEALKGSVWVFIRRRNIVNQAVSRVMARQSGVTHATGDKSEHFADKNALRGYDEDYNAGLTYNKRAIARQVGAIASANQFWENFFERSGIIPVELVYEEYAFDERMPHLASISEAAGIQGVNAKARSMVKMGNHRNDEWARRFLDEVAVDNFRVE